MSQKKTKKEITLNDLGDLNPRELELIYYIRTKFKYGELVIQTRDGLPFRIKQTTEFQSLG